jgi:hypothetical protein
MASQRSQVGVLAAHTLTISELGFRAVNCKDPVFNWWFASRMHIEDEQQGLLSLGFPDDCRSLLHEGFK